MDDASVGAHSCAPLPADRTSPAPPAIADFACQISLGHKVSGVGTAHQQSQYRPGIVGWAVPTPQLTIPLFSLDFGPWTLDFSLLQRHPFSSSHIVQVRQDAFLDRVLWRNAQLS